jgi:hypothetical protein
MTELPSETARLSALDRFDRSERRIYGFVIVLTVLEMIFIWGFAELADFSNRVHVLIFWSILSGYGPMLAGLGLLWAHVSRSTRLVLKAIDLSTRRVPVETARTSNPLGLGPDF